jgi:hypothetical protein
MKKATLALSIWVAVLAVATAGMASAATPPAHVPIYMPNTQNVGNPTLQPPPVCCAPQGPPVAGEPAPVNMAYFGGHVQIDPKVYLVYWGWGEPGAFNHTTPGMPADDPDGAAARMTAFIRAVGGTNWAAVSTQYYETVNGQNVYVQNPSNVLGGATRRGSNRRPPYQAASSG